jgi:outer membrane protein assembly factor BamD
MVKSYDAMGMTELRDDAQRVSPKHSPNSEIASGKKQGKNWWQFWK